jgi:gag-polyprotein putative aspartyl protease
MKPSFHRPYLQIKIQNLVSVRGLYDTGADISCLSLKVFQQILHEHRPKKLEGQITPKFKSAGAQILPVCGRYQFRVQIGIKTLQHNFYVIPELNESLILGIDFIQ